MVNLKSELAGKVKYIAFLVVFATLGLASKSIRAEEVNGTGEQATSHQEKFEAGKFVTEHVSDAFEWHILTYKHHHISVPLPIILYSKNSGLNIFWSSKFEHGHAAYRNFRIEEAGDNAGKIVELNSSGEVIGLPIDLSITKTVAGIFISAFILLFILLRVARMAKQSANKAPTGLQNMFEPLVIFIRDEVAIPTIGEKRYQKYLPFLLTIFFFILLNNLLGLIPIFPFGANVTGNIAVTMVLALFTFIITTFSGNKHYWKEIYNPDVPWWLKFPVPLMPLVELTGVITKPIVLMVRLFANMLAGHMIVTVFVALIFIFGQTGGIAAGLAVSPLSVLFSVFILLLDVLVSFIQAYVFTLLSALYFGMAIAEHHPAEEH
jgi:F-type H+-transporting ATPase subunit a